MKALARFSFGFCLALGVATLPAPDVGAAPDAKELSRARAKFQRATELEQAGQYAAALETFREVGQVRMTPQVRYHIAFCEEKLGKLVTALGGYELAAADAGDVGPAFEKEVAGRIEDLKARIPKLVIRRGSGAEAAKIELDGVALGESSIGVEMPVDPGPHTVSAKALGFEPFAKTIEVAEKDVKPVEIVLEEADGDAPVAATATSAGPSDPGVTETAGPSKVPPLVIGAVGLASLAASGVFFYLRQDALSELEEACSGGTCPPEQEDTYDKAKTYNTVGLVTLGVGVVGVGVAATWLLTQGSPSKTEAGWQLSPAAPGATAGASVIGRF